MAVHELEQGELDLEGVLGSEIDEVRVDSLNCVTCLARQGAFTSVVHAFSPHRYLVRSRWSLRPRVVMEGSLRRTHPKMTSFPCTVQMPCKLTYFHA